MLEEKRRQRERGIMEEGRALWQNKKREELEREIRDVEEVSSKFLQISFGKNRKTDVSALVQPCFAPACLKKLQLTLRTSKIKIKLQDRF